MTPEEVPGLAGLNEAIALYQRRSAAQPWATPAPAPKSHLAYRSPESAAKRAANKKYRRALSLQLQRAEWAAMPPEDRLERAQREAGAAYDFQRRALERRGTFTEAADAANIAHLQDHYRDHAGVELTAEAIRATPRPPADPPKPKRPRRAPRWRPGQPLPFEPFVGYELRKRPQPI